MKTITITVSGKRACGKSTVIEFLLPILNLIASEVKHTSDMMPDDLKYNNKRLKALQARGICIEVIENHSLQREV